MKKIRGMLATAFLCHFCFVSLLPAVAEGDLVPMVEQQPLAMKKHTGAKYRPPLHEKFYLRCDDAYIVRVTQFLKTATHEEILQFLAYVVDTLTLWPQDELEGYDNLYISNASIASYDLFCLFERTYFDFQTGEVNVVEEGTKAHKIGRNKKKLLDCYLENHYEEALKFYAVCADYDFALIYFYFMLPSITRDQLYEIDFYYNNISTILSTKFSLWHETGNESQSYVNYYQEAFKRVGRLFMKLPQKLAKTEQ